MQETETEEPLIPRGQTPWGSLEGWHDRTVPSFGKIAEESDYALKFDMAGLPINLEMFAWLFEDNSYRLIAQHFHMDPPLEVAEFMVDYHYSESIARDYNLPWEREGQVQPLDVNLDNEDQHSNLGKAQWMVSTIWTGLNSSIFRGEGAIIFESWLFGTEEFLDPGGWNGGAQLRSGSYSQAMEIHNELVNVAFKRSNELSPY